MKLFHNKMDAWVVLVVAAEVAALVTIVLLNRHLAWWFLVPVGILISVVICANYQSQAHQAIHNPFFVYKPLNSLFGVMCSMALGMPYTLFKHHHFNHHTGNNDKPSQPRATRDLSSSYRFSPREDKPENLLIYTLLGPFRLDWGYYIRQARKKGDILNVVTESLAIIGMMLCFAWIDLHFFLVWYLPVWVAAQHLSFFHNYVEHHNAIPGNRLTDAVSCYDRAYNFLFFNNGYHQEHHFSPSTHWTQMKALRAQMLPDEARKVVRHGHFMNFRWRPAAHSADHHVPTQ
ncbi:MAG: fatty acid desaturase [Alcanivoracaceae bacterium]|nr:fatty acid desaturase [Alcanivoracaceae bacterium]